MRYDSLTYLEIKAKSQKEWLVILPTGCTEQQGPHLPVVFDTWLVENITFAASARAWKKYQVGSLVLPALPRCPLVPHPNIGISVSAMCISPKTFTADWLCRFSIQWLNRALIALSSGGDAVGIILIRWYRISIPII
jgi:creatinine amidohydrolase